IAASWRCWHSSVPNGWPFRSTPAIASNAIELPLLRLVTEQRAKTGDVIQAPERGHSRTGSRSMPPSVGKEHGGRRSAPGESGAAPLRQEFPGGSNSVSLVLRARGSRSVFLRRHKPGPSDLHPCGSSEDI